MRKMLTELQYGMIKLAFQQRKSIRGAAAETGLSINAVRRAVELNFKRKAYKRAPKATVAKRRKALVALSKKVTQKGHRKWPTYSSSVQLAQALRRQTGETVSARQVQRDLHAAGLKAFVRPKCPTRTTPDVQKRRAFAKKHRQINWKKVVFTDESWICCNERTGRYHWCRSRRDVLELERKARWNVCSAMVWGAVGFGFKSSLIVFPSKVSCDGELRVFRLDAQSYIRRCLSSVVPALLKEGRVLQQDGARSHASRLTQAYLQRKGVATLDEWPPYSPDLNAIERIWKELNARIGARCPMSTEELLSVAREEWEKMPQSLIDKHCSHFPHQLSALCSATLKKGRGARAKCRN